MISELANHLWQSTLFALAVGLHKVLVSRVRELDLLR